MAPKRFDRAGSGIGRQPKYPACAVEPQAVKVGIVIPALNEEGSIGAVVKRVMSTLRGLSPSNLSLSNRIVVADNGSSDSTAQEAEWAGAEVVKVPVRGYGAACMAAVRFLDTWPDVMVFLDADGSSRPEEVGRLLEPVCCGRAEMVLGVRPVDAPMTFAQRWGTLLALWLVKVRWGTVFQDMGPYRSILRESLELLNLKDRSWGWTIEMQIQAIRNRVSWIEVPVSWERRLAGSSKISGSLTGVIRAGTKIVWTIFRYSLKRNR